MNKDNTVRDIIENGEATSDDSGYQKVVETYTCLVGKESETGTVYISSCGLKNDTDDSTQYSVFVDYGEENSVVGISTKISSEIIHSKTKDVIEFVKEIFPPC